MNPNMTELVLYNGRDDFYKCMPYNFQSNYNLIFVESNISV